MDSGQTAAAPPWAPRLARAVSVAGVWSLGLAPLLAGWPPCLLARLLGAPCPTCGVTRALRLLFAGHPLESLRMHPLAVPLAIAVATFAGATVIAGAVHGSVADVRRIAIGRAAFFAIAALYATALVLWIARLGGLFGGPVAVP